MECDNLDSKRTIKYVNTIDLSGQKHHPDPDKIWKTPNKRDGLIAFWIIFDSFMPISISKLLFLKWVSIMETWVQGSVLWLDIWKNYLLYSEHTINRQKCHDHCLSRSLAIAFDQTIKYTSNFGKESMHCHLSGKYLMKHCCTPTWLSKWKEIFPEFMQVMPS